MTVTIARKIFDIMMDSIIRPLPVRGKFRLLSRRVMKMGTVSARVHGWRMQLDLGDLIHRGMYLGSFEMAETRWVRSTLKAGDTAIDIGANCGWYTSLFSQLCGANGRVIAVDANPHLSSRLQQCIQSNRIENVEVICAGASNCEGEIKLYIPPYGNEDATMAIVEGWTEVIVPLVTLDRELMKRNVEKIRLVKIDVEGHELKVLQGMKSFLSAGRVEYLLMEFNDYWLRQQGTSQEELAAYCKSLGFEGQFNGTPIPKNSFANIVFKYRS